MVWVFSSTEQRLTIGYSSIFALQFFGTTLETIEEKNMQFIPLESEAQLTEILSQNSRLAILKHNTTCSISKGVLDRLQSDDSDVPGVQSIYVLDLLANRPVSDSIAGRFGVPHQSPQILVVENGRCIYHEWGFDISAEAIANAVSVT
jgi:bacillithiol system protein YtxJ